MQGEESQEKVLDIMLESLSEAKDEFTKKVILERIEFMKTTKILHVPFDQEMIPYNEELHGNLIQKSNIELL